MTYVLAQPNNSPHVPKYKKNTPGYSSLHEDPPSPQKPPNRRTLLLFHETQIRPRLLLRREERYSPFFFFDVLRLCLSVAINKGALFLQCEMGEGAFDPRSGYVKASGGLWYGVRQQYCSV